MIDRRSIADWSAWAAIVLLCVAIARELLAGDWVVASLASVVLAVVAVRRERTSLARQRAAEEARRDLEKRLDDATTALAESNAALEIALGCHQRAESSARDARDEAERASRTKSDFLAHMSHEIRTPMTSILGWSEQLRGGGLTPAERVEAIDAIRRSGEHLLAVVDDVLDLSKIEAGRLSIERIPCSPFEIVRDVERAMRVRAESRGLRFDVEWSNAVPERIETDPVRLRQVLLNLVGNAIKFTERGGVMLRVELVRAPAGDRLAFVVRDTGIGMTSVALERLFEPFVQGDVATTRKFGGTGLGLAISRGLVERLGGKIRVTSELGRGSEFAFDVETGPLEGVELVTAAMHPAAPLPAARTVRAHDFDGVRILVAEDGDDARRLVVHLLESSGAEVVAVCDGLDAERLALEAQRDGRPFDAVLMDMQMPVADGYTTTRSLRARGYTRPIIALTANAMRADRNRCLAAGCSDYCSKPILRDALFETLARWCDRRLTGAGSSVASEVCAIDDPELLELTRQFLDSLATDLAAMHAALASHDAGRLGDLAHRLKGAAGSYGFPEVGDRAAVLEADARRGADEATLASALDALDVACRVAAGARP